VIEEGPGGHGAVVDEAPIFPPVVARCATSEASGKTRLREMVRDHLDFAWRSLRRLGLRADEADDATQRVFVVASQRLSDIEAGCEKAFLFNTAVHVASSARRALARRREVPHGDNDPEATDPAPGPDELIDRRRARTLLEEALLEMPMERRSVFVLFELEQMTIAEIAQTLALPEGTVASRLRRARQEFQGWVKRFRAKNHYRGAAR
jgi:RNA polymerase sigma-70 factor (ECF subfamily)